MQDLGAFYDRYPYPPPAGDLTTYRQIWDDQNRRRADHHLFWPEAPYREDMTILVAGCGTSQAAKYALRQPAAQVIGIDVSSTSIDHTQKLKRKHELRNLELERLPVERARELGQYFDKIICTGVLHHLSDPDAGLRALRDVLRPGGALHLMVYAPYGRVGVYMLQDYCRRVGIRPSDQEISDLAVVLRSLPKDHPLLPLLRAAPDFLTEAGVADALLHPRDRAYTVSQFFDLIEGADLVFGRWLRQAPYLPKCGAPADTPHSARLAALPVRDQYAAVELFRGTMVRHSAILYHADGSGADQAIRFDDHRWLSYVPIRLPRTIRVKTQPAPDVTAVLINQSHTYTDLIVPISEAEEQLFEAIDGRCSIAEIIRRTLTSDSRRRPREQARAFFERLWWYDQLVFDASRPTVGGEAEG